MATGAVGKQIELLLLDAIFHLTAGAIEPVVETFRCAAEVRHDIAWIAPVGPDNPW